MRKALPPEDPHLETLPDLIGPDVELLFVGINPGLKSARVGHYYAGPGNLFWRCLYEGGLTPILLTPYEDDRVLEWGIGITDCVKRPSRGAADVRSAEFRDGLPDLLRRIEVCSPRVICFNGLMGYRQAVDPDAQLGLQERTIAGAAVFVVPSTSAANAGFTREERVEWFRKVAVLWRDGPNGSEPPQ